MKNRKKIWLSEDESFEGKESNYLLLRKIPFEIGDIVEFKKEYDYFELNYMKGSYYKIIGHDLKHFHIILEEYPYNRSNYMHFCFNVFCFQKVQTEKIDENLHKILFPNE